MSRRYQTPKRPRQKYPVCQSLVAVDRLGRYRSHGPGSWRGGEGCDGSYRMAQPPS